MAIKKSIQRVSKADYQLSDQPTRIIDDIGEFQHIVSEEAPQVLALYPILVELDTYLKMTSTNISEDDVKIAINGYADRVITQLLQNNATELPFADKNIAVCESILTNDKWDTATLTPEAMQIVKSVKAIFEQYQGLLVYVLKYTEAYNYKFSDDNTAHLTYFKGYVDSVVNAYVYKLCNATGEIDKVDALISRKALYTFLLQADVTLIEPNTQISNFVGMIQAVQNVRIYRGRELMIIALNEVIAVSNLIRLMWLLIQLNYQTLQLENKDNRDLYDELIKLIEEFEKTRDPSLLDRILELIKQIEDELKKKAEESSEVSKIGSDLIAIGKLQDKSAIRSYIDTLNSFIDKINRITADLSRFNFELDYSSLQSVLNKLEVLQGLLDKLLGDNKLTQYFEKVNEIILAINRTAEAIKAVNCLIKQAMCFIASTLNFVNSVVAPAIKNIQDTIKRLGEDTETIIDNFVRDALAPFDDAIRLYIYEQARVILKGRAYELSTALGRDDTFITEYNNIIDAVIDSAINGGTSALDYLKAQSRGVIQGIADSFVPDERSATNCPPLTVKGNLSIPNLSLQANIPSINPVNLSVEC